jgi:hypothetical protein
MGLCGTIFYAFRHCVSLFPHDIHSQVPAVSTKGKGDKPREADHIFGLQSNILIKRPVPLHLPLLIAFAFTPISRSSITIPQHKPQSPIIA